MWCISCSSDEITNFTIHQSTIFFYWNIYLLIFFWIEIIKIIIHQNSLKNIRGFVKINRWFDVTDKIVNTNCFTMRKFRDFFCFEDLVDSWKHVMSSWREWKFTRASTWIHYYDDNHAIPVPFNVIPSVYGMQKFVKWLKSCCCPTSKIDGKDRFSFGWPPPFPLCAYVIHGCSLRGLLLEL